MGAMLRTAFATACPVRAAQAAAAAGVHHEQALACPDVDDGYTSLQPLGMTKVLVCYSLAPGGVQIDGALVNGYMVEADDFSSRQVKDWAQAIDAERIEAAQRAEADAREAWTC